MEYSKEDIVQFTINNFMGSDVMDRLEEYFRTAPIDYDSRTNGYNELIQNIGEGNLEE